MSRPSLRLPKPDGTLERYELAEPRTWPAPSAPLTSRVAYAAAHVVADPFSDTAPGAPAVLDWDETLAFRRRLWSYGLGVADAMDTAQRGMGMDWPATAELIRRSAAEARACGGALACGAGTDQAPAVLDKPADVVEAYLEQLEVVEGAGATPILMASRQLAALAGGPDDYAEVYGRVLEQAGQPVILHWLGEAFDPALAGYWGASGTAAAGEHVLAIIRDNAAKVDGIKISVFDADFEESFRRALPAGVRLYTGDDFDYPRLILGDEAGHSDALLGIFDAIAPIASSALQALDRGDVASYDACLAPTVPLARHLFAAPTYHYKAGIVFLAWLGGHQRAFTLVGGLASARSVLHLSEAFRLADAAGCFQDPALAARRMQDLLAVAGVER